MTLQIPITGVPQSYRVPGGYGEILYAQGPASVAAGVREVVLVMPMLSTGTWTANTLYRVRSEKDAEDGAGPGSPLHRGVRAFLRVNKDAKLWALPVAETTGGVPDQAEGTVTISGTASGAGTLEVDVCGETIVVGIQSSDTADAIGTALAAAGNSKTWLPVTFSNTTGTVTIRAKLNGISQGTATVPAIRFRSRITAGITTTRSDSGAFLGTSTTGAEGSTTEAAQFATALAVIDNTRKYYIVTSAIDATSWGSLETHVTTKSQPKRGLRSKGIAPYVGTLADAQTLATGRNYERLQPVWQLNSELDPCSLAGVMAAIIQQEEGRDSAANMAGYSTSEHIPPAYSTGDWPDGDDQNDAINDGITAIASNDSGTYIVMSVNSRSKNSAGTVDDFRATETHRVSVTDEFMDEELAAFALNYQGKKLEADELLPDGKFNPNQKPKPGVIRASGFKPHIGARMDDFNDAGKLQDLAASKASIRVIKTGSRLEVGFDLHVIDHLHQATYRVAETSTG